MKREQIEDYVQLNVVDIPKARQEIDRHVAIENELKNKAAALEKEIRDERRKGEVRIWTAQGYHVMVSDEGVQLVREGALE